MKRDGGHEEGRESMKREGMQEEGEHLMMEGGST